MSHDSLDTFAWLLDEAFSGDGAHGLRPNLAHVSDAAWSVVPAGGARSIADVLEHVGWAKWRYENYAFGDASLSGGEPSMLPAGGNRTRPRAELLAWLRDGHARLMASVRALADDAELDRPRLTNWGERRPTRDLLRILIAHDSYHAGEINHLRALAEGDDQWPYGGP